MSASIRKTRARIEISGIVQGVGFRPFVYRMAQKHHLAGFVANTPFGVEIEVEGRRDDIDRFLEDIKKETPPLASIVDCVVNYSEPVGYEDFKIVKSAEGAEKTALISPDIATCDDCFLELLNPEDRRFLYPFINCTNCGPRHTITENIPYDRKNTSMRVFKMCPACEAEYENPENRRFHAQPNACWECGPGLKLLDANGNEIKCDNPIGSAIELLKNDFIVAIKGLGGFHLAADAASNNAVLRLRERKHREEKPLAVMARGIDEILKFARVTEEQKALLLSPQRPIALLEKPRSNPLAQAVSPRNKYFGVFLPYTPIHHLLFRQDGGKIQDEPNFLALVMTSGNFSEEPIAVKNDEATERLRGIADAFLVHNREILVRSDDSVCKISDGKPQPLRRSRGYAPAPIILRENVKEILACGAELKNTVCLTKGKFAFLSQHIGDLENFETLKFFEETTEYLKKTLEINPEIIAYDLHPDYLSTKWALSQSGKTLVGVQHHHAHIASVMAEHGVSEDVIGVALDGTGYGADGTIWGGEALVANLKNFTRAAHLEYLPMPGGAQAIREPWRMGVAYLYKAFGEEIHNLNINFVKNLGEDSLGAVIKLCESGINSPPTSSCGRLFDAVSAISGVRQKVRYEGQAAMELEMSAEEGEAKEIYEFNLSSQNEVVKISTDNIIKGVVADMESGRKAPFISLKFHASLARAFADAVKSVGAKTGIKKVALSGGVFQNSLFADILKKMLIEDGHEVYTHSKVPPNDGGLSLGQAIVAHHKSAGG